MQTDTGRTKLAYVVIDTHNGLFDGFYFDADRGRRALQHWGEFADKYCLRMNLMLAEVSQKQINDGISDEKFMPTAWHKALNEGGQTNESTNTI